MNRKPPTKRRNVPVERHWGKWAFALLVAVILIVLAAFLYRYLTQDPDVVAIKGRIESARQAAVRKDLAACIAYMDTSYTDNLDNNYDRVRRRVGEKFDEVSDISIKIRKLEVEVEKARGLAVAKFEMRTTGKYEEGGGGKIPFFGVLGNRSIMSAGWEKVSTVWKSQQGEWLVAQMRIEPLKQ